MTVRAPTTTHVTSSLRIFVVGFSPWTKAHMIALTGASCAFFQTKFEVWFGGSPSVHTVVAADAMVVF